MFIVTSIGTEPPCGLTTTEFHAYQLAVLEAAARADAAKIVDFESFKAVRNRKKRRSSTGTAA